MLVACLQYQPEFKDPLKTIAKVNGLLDNLTQEISILLLPECAFAGYCFQSQKEIEPFLEDSETGQTVTWAKQTSLRFNCLVQVGYPRKDLNSMKYFNSICLCHRGQLIHTYDKHFLFPPVDDIWATPGKGFECIEMKEFGKIGLGICMDINPFRFEAPFDAFEFSEYQAQQQVDFIFLSMAWNAVNEQETSRDILNYWAHRLLPLLKLKHRVIVMICNRTGREHGKRFFQCFPLNFIESKFAGTSCIFEFKNEKISLLNALTMQQEAILLQSIEEQQHAV